MKSGLSHSMAARLVIAPHEGQAGIALYRAGRLGLAVRPAGQRYPESALQQLFRGQVTVPGTRSISNADLPSELIGPMARGRMMLPFSKQSGHSGE